MLDGKIEAKEILFKDLFDSKFLFQIPGYQRPYSWETDQFDQLFEDIRSAMESGEDHYFLGSVILQTTKQGGDGSGAFDVVDGQQRLTTLSILVAVMRDLVENPKAKSTLHNKIYQEKDEYENTPEEMRLTVRDKDLQFYKKYILTQDGIYYIDDAPNTSESQQHMQQAVDTFYFKFFDDNLEIDKDLLDKMIKYLLNHCVFVIVKTGSFTSAYRLFSVLNDRGLPLTTSDLLKSTNLSAIPPAYRDHYQKTWEVIEEELGRADLDQLFAHIRTIYLKEKAKKSIIDEYEKVIFANQPSLKGQTFIDKLKNISNIYLDQIMDAHTSKNHVKFYNLMSLMRDYIPNSDWVPVYLSFAQKFTKLDEQYEFLVQLERLFVVNWLLEVTPTVRIMEMNRLLGLIDRVNKMGELYKDDIFDLKGYYVDVEAGLNMTNFYRKKYGKYILLRLDMAMHDNANIMRKYAGTITVEHVLPQTPTEYWMKMFNEDERNEWTHKLGNLVLLSNAKNSSANNKPFDQKLKKYYTKGLTDFALTKQISNYTKWDINVVQQRHQDLVKIAMGLWCV